VRGVTITVDPVTGLPADKVPFLVKAKGAEVGARSKAIPGLDSAVAVFVLEYESELLFVGDAGTPRHRRDARALHRFRPGRRPNPGRAEHGGERGRGGG
jgi:hypothetical protein